MTTIPTALEFLNRDESGVFNEVDITQAMIGFAKLHVQAALESAADNALTRSVPYSDDVVIDDSTILEAYQLDNIQ